VDYCKQGKIVPAINRCLQHREGGKDVTFEDTAGGMIYRRNYIHKIRNVIVMEIISCTRNSVLCLGPVSNRFLCSNTVQDI
jgi:hypothetical protein